MTRFMVRAVVAAAVLLAAPRPAPAGYLGREFPDFSATDPLTGREFSLSDLRGKVVVVDFWASWCGPCRREMPTLLELRDAYKDRGVEIVGISLDHDMERFRKFVADNGMSWIHVMEGGGWSTRLAKQYGIRSIPSMYVLDAGGVCVAERVRGQSLHQAVDRAVAAAEAAAAHGKSDQGIPEYAGLSGQLGRARLALQPILGPLDDLTARLDGLEVVADRLEPVVTATEGGPAAVRGRLDRLRDDVEEVRHALFMMGIIADERALSAVPADMDAAADLAAVRLAIGRMREACAEVGVQVREVDGRIRRLQEDISKRAAAADVLQDRIGAVGDDALTLSGLWCDPWIGQLDRAEDIIEEARAAAGACGDVDGLAAEAAAIRRAVEVKLADGSDLTELRDRFSDLARRLLACRDRIRGL